MTATTGLTTHVLDTAHGRPAAGVRIVLTRPGGIEVRAVTDADGRTDAPLVDPLVDGTYELTFDIGAYFAAVGETGVTAGGSPGEAYLGQVPVRVNLRAAMGHVHVALLVTPWSYTTYRGS